MAGGSAETRHRRLEDTSEPKSPDVEMRMVETGERRTVVQRPTDRKPTRSLPQNENQAPRPTSYPNSTKQPRKSVVPASSDRSYSQRASIAEPNVHGSRFSVLRTEIDDEPRSTRSKRRSSGEHDIPRHSSVSPPRHSHGKHNAPPSSYNNPKTGLGRSASERRTSGSMDYGTRRETEGTVRLQKKPPERRQDSQKAQEMVNRLSTPKRIATRPAEKPPVSPRNSRPETSLSSRSARSERIADRNTERAADRAAERAADRAAERAVDRAAERAAAEREASERAFERERHAEREHASQRTAELSKARQLQAQRSAQNPRGQQPEVTPRGSSKHHHQGPMSPPQTPKNQRGPPQPEHLAWDAPPPSDPRFDSRHMDPRMQRRAPESQEQSMGWLGSVPLVGQMFRYTDNSPPAPPKEYYQNLERENMWLKQQLEQAKQSRDGMNHSLSVLNATNEQLNADLLLIQQKSLGEMSKATWVPLEDQAILDVFEEIHKDIEDWADDNCVDTLEELKERLSDEQKAQLMAFMKPVAELNCKDFNSQIDYWVNCELDPVLLLKALATHHMYLSIFRSPFGVLDILAPDQNLSYVLLGMYRQLILLDSKQAHQWRSQMMRILFHQPTSGGKFDGLRPRNETLDLAVFVHNRCQLLVEIFEAGPVSLLFKTEREPESRAQLVDCFVRTMEIFTQLQTQVSSLEWSDPQNFHLVEFSGGEE
ncbi:hypothetical protein G7Y89_g14199 [Cudoniella acicularis]|uniref:Uncharacterized protein n=1 Tax=Cudoniella acicularis TaxID=354080 RepID=A0A8H4VU53_9HELO|nr:hypothetical protein G7Y89_g14199 [Cudoniella acicularis]